MTATNNSKLQNCLVEDRGTLVNATSFLLNLDRKKVSKRSVIEIINKLEKAHLNCEDILDDLHEMNFDIIKLPNDFGELLMIWFGAATRWTQNETPRKTNNKTTQKKTNTNKTGLKTYVGELIGQGEYTWNQIVEKTLDQFPGEKKKLATLKSIFRSTKHSPKDKVMATRGDGIVQWI